MKGTEWCQPNAETCNILLRAFAQARNVNQVNALFKDLDESIVSPVIYTYNGVLDAYGGKWDYLRNGKCTFSHEK
jgi:pentatricopeptide repeat protein